MGLIALRCPYCGGQLTPVGTRFECIYCGNLVVQDNSSQTVKNGHKSESPILYSLCISGTIQLNTTFCEEIQFIFRYRKRVTLADAFPMNVTIHVDGRPISFIEEFENVGDGTITISVEDQNTLILKKGRLKAEVNDTLIDPFTEYPLGSVIVIGKLNFKIEKHQT